MHFAIVMADGIGSQLYHWIFSAVFLQYLVAFLFAFMFPITSAAIINYLERKVMAWMQDRKGPLHVGPHGSLQLLADIGKMFTKEDIHAAQTDKMIFLLAPSAFLALYRLAGNSPRHRHRLPGGDEFTRRDRCDHGRLGLKQQVLVDGWTTFGGANDLLRITPRAGPRRRRDADQRPCRFAGLSREYGHRHHLNQRGDDLPEHLEGYGHRHPGLHLQRLYAVGMVHSGPAVDAPHLLYLRPGRDKPRSLRSPGSRIGTGSRFSHRI